MIDNLTTPELAQCLAILKTADKPLTAIEIAAQLGFYGTRETQRRHIRALVQKLREFGNMIVANLSEGYWITDDAGLWRDYLEGRQIDAKKILGITHKQKKMISDRFGQGRLFGPVISTGIG